MQEKHVYGFCLCVKYLSLIFLCWLYMNDNNDIFFQLKKKIDFIIYLPCDYCNNN